ncbi:hypothetical protein HY229_03970 [Candidatus Acetothermia bacterium]|nr:hypothetical protein [Candidatus Acetothermia bacterium]MBI3643240.1 hypothetical protein [Candidatus Acetothermia bacterium]
MLKLRSLKFLAMLASIGALFVLGATQTASLASKGTDAGLAITPCNGPSKVFSLDTSHSEASLVSAVEMRIAPAIAIAQLRFNPQPDEILLDQNGLLELRYSQSVMKQSEQLQVEVCGASPTQVVREAYWIMHASGQLVAQMVSADNISWTWKENGENVIPGTQLTVKEISCAGQPLVQPMQLIAQAQPICVKDPEALNKLTAQMNRAAQDQTSFFGKVSTLLFGTKKFDEQMTKLNTQMQQMYLYSPYDGTVQGITQDTLNGMNWIKLQVEESSKVSVAQ